MNFGPHKACTDCHRPMPPKEQHRRCHTCRGAGGRQKPWARDCRVCGQRIVSKDNHLRCWRCRVPEAKRPTPKLTTNDVRQIRALRGEKLEAEKRIQEIRARLQDEARKVARRLSAAAVAGKFGVSPRCVQKIWAGHSYKGIPAADTRRVRPDVSEKEVLRLFAELRGQGWTLPAITGELVARGVFTSGASSHD